MALKGNNTQSASYEMPRSCFQRLVQQNLSDPFVIYLSSEYGEKVTIETTVNEARIISKKINDLFYIDPTITEYEITFPLDKLSKYQIIELSDLEESVKLLIKSTQESIQVPLQKLRAFSIVLFYLGTSDEDDQIASYFQFFGEPEAISLIGTEFNSLSVQYLSDHLIDLFENDNVNLLPNDVVYEIIDHRFPEGSHYSSDIESLFKCLKPIERYHRYLMYILTKVEIPFTNKDVFKFISEHIDDNTIGDSFPQLVNFFKRSISKLISNPLINQNKCNIIDCKFVNDQLSGIIKFMVENMGTNSFGLIGSGSVNPQYPITNIIKYDDENIDCPYQNFIDGASLNYDGFSENWIIFDFLPRKVNVTSYTLRTGGLPMNVGCRPKSWMICGSNDGKKWEPISEITNCSLLNADHQMFRFECKKIIKFFRFIGYRQTNSWNQNPSMAANIDLTCIEFFGSISL